MGKNKNKKKRLEAQKVRLKVGRRLLKSNMTSTVFKTGKIVLTEQIPHFRAVAPDEANETATNGVLEDLLKDAIAKMSHCNSAARYKAVCWLRKTLNKRADFIAEHLHEVLQRVLLLLRDSDGVVREATRLLIGQLLTRLSDAQFEPHWPLLAKHLAIIFTSSPDMNLHSECVNLLRHIGASRPRAIVAHCTSMFQAFVTRLCNLQPATLVPYLTINVGDGSLAAIATTAEPVLDRFLQLLTHGHEVGLALLSESEGDDYLGFRPREFLVETCGENAKSLYFFVYSPLSLCHRMQMQQFSSLALVGTGETASNGSSAPITFREKVEEIARLIDVVKKIKK